MSVKRSDSIVELATALSKAQGAVKDAEKNATNPHLNNDYANLYAVRESIRQPFLDNGLSILHLPHTTPEGRMVVTSVLLHQTGQFIESEAILPLEKNTMQGIGSGLTYWRRYFDGAVSGCSQKDDDANLSEAEMAKRKKTNQGASAGSGNRAGQKPSSSPGGGSQTHGQRGNSQLSDKQAKRLFAKAGTAGWTNDQLKVFVKEKMNLAKIDDMSQENYDKLCAYLDGLAPKRPPQDNAPPFMPDEMMNDAQELQPGDFNPNEVPGFLT